MYGLKLPFIRFGPTHEILNGRLSGGARIKLKTSYYDTMLDYRFFQKIKLLEYGKFNYLTTYF